MKKRRNYSEKLLEKTPFGKLFHGIRRFFILSTESLLLPNQCYSFMNIMRMMHIGLCLLLTGLPMIWEDDVEIKHIFQFFEIFWRFSANYTSKNSLSISFIVDLILHILIILIILGFYILFAIFGRTTRITATITAILTEVILPLLYSWTASQVATVISLVATDSSYRETTYYVQIVFYVLLIVLFILITIFITNNEIQYMKGRSIMWDFATQKIYIILTPVNLLLTRFIELLPKIPSLIFSILCALYTLGFCYYIFYYAPFVDRAANHIQIAFPLACLVAFVVQVISYQITIIDVAIPILLVAVLSVVIDFILVRLNIKRRNRAVDLLDILSTGELSFEEAFKNPPDFLFFARRGFQSGNSYIFSWKPFIAAIDAYPKNREIWIQWIRFAAIYADQGRRLEQIANEFQEHGFKDRVSKNVISQVKLIQKSRSKHITRDLKQELQSLHERIVMTKGLIVSYWNQIGGGSANSNSIYDISKKLSDSFQSIQNDYLYLLTVYPNNYAIANSYSEFLTNVVSDPQEGQIMSHKANAMKRSQHIIKDSTQIYGFECFPFIPHSLDQLDNVTVVVDNDILGLPDHKKKDDKAADDDTNIDVNNASSVSSFNEEDDNNTQSHILELGQTAKIIFVTRIFIVLIVFFIIAFIIIPFLPPILFNILMNNYRDMYDSIQSINNIDLAISKVAFYSLYQTAITEGVALDTANKPNMARLVDADMVIMNSDINQLEAAYGGTISHDSRSGKFLHETVVHLHQPDNSEIEGSFFEAINAVAAATFRFNKVGVSLREEPWMEFLLANIGQVLQSLEELAKLLCYDMNDELDTQINLIEAILIVVIAFEVILLPFFFVFVFFIRRDWNYILDTINSMPRAALQKVIQKYSSTKEKDEESLQRNEMRYQSLFVHMVSSRDTTGGIPIALLVSLFIFNFVISVACLVIIIILMNSLLGDLVSVPMQSFQSSVLRSNTYKVVAQLFLKLIVDKFDTVSHYNSTIINEEVFQLAEQYSILTTELQFGTYDEMYSGVLEGPPESVELLTKRIGSPFGTGNIINMTNALNQFPICISSQLFAELFWKIAREFHSSQSKAAPYMRIVYNLMNLALLSIEPKFVKPYSIQSHDFFDDSLSSTTGYLVLIAVVVLLIGIFSVSWLFILLFKIKRTAQFVLTSLSMLEPNYVLDQQNVMNLFYGNTSGIVPTNQTLQRMFTEVEDLIPENSIELDRQLTIVHMDPRISEAWELENVEGSNIKILLTFRDHQVLKEITALASGQGKSKTYNTTININSTKKDIDISFTSYYVPHNEKSSLVLLIESNLNLDKKKQEIEVLEKANNETKLEIVPIKLRSKLNLESKQYKFTVHYLLFAAIDITNIDSYGETHSPKETHQFFNGFVDEVKSQCSNELIDAILIRDTGNTLIVVFNASQQITNYYKPAQEAYEFIKSLNEFAASKGYEFKSSLITAKSAVGSLSPKGSLRFGLYTKNLPYLLTLLGTAESKRIVFPSKVKEYLPPEISSTAEEVELRQPNQEPEWVYSIHF